MIENRNFKPVIGIEIHIQLKTKSKLFSNALNNPDERQSNLNIDEVVTGQPGTLPVLNKEAVRLGIMVGLALNCQIDEYSKFDRKHYFYPDLPKGYQISQYDQPIAKNGFVNIEIAGKTKRINITRAHLEEDAGKNIHPPGLPYSLVDYNRAGAPLLEIVTEPDIETGEEAKIFLQTLRNIVRYVGASDADMEKGTMRCEPNISVKMPGQTSLPAYKVEVKNLNSFRFVEMAINYEIERQMQILVSGSTPKQVTMGWNEKTNATVEQRSKEEAHDYRYFPEPDLPILHFTPEYLNNLKNTLPELPEKKIIRFRQEFGLPSKDIADLISDKALAGYFEEVVSELQEWFHSENIPGDITKFAKLACNWITGDYQASLKTLGLNPNEAKVSPENLAELIKMIDRGEISITAGKKVLEIMFEKGGDPSNIVQDEGLAQVSDEHALITIIQKIIADHPKPVSEFKNGKTQVLGFLVGQVMVESKGKANPQIVTDLLTKTLNSL